MEGQTKMLNSETEQCGRLGRLWGIGAFAPQCQNLVSYQLVIRCARVSTNIMDLVRELRMLCNCGPVHHKAPLSSPAGPSRRNCQPSEHIRAPLPSKRRQLCELTIQQLRQLCELTARQSPTPQSARKVEPRTSPSSPPHCHRSLISCGLAYEGGLYSDSGPHHGGSLFTPGPYARF